MDLRSPLASVWLRRWWIVGGAVLVGVAVLVVSSLLPARYAATTVVRVVETGADAPRSDTVAYYAQAVVGVAGTAQALDLAVARAGLPLSRDQAAAQTEVVDTGTPGFVTVTARAGTPADAARLADGMSATLAERVAQDHDSAVAGSTAPLQAQARQLAGQLAALPPGAPDRAAVEQRYASLVDAVTRLQSGGAPQVLLGTSAAVPTRPESPVPLRDAGIGAGAALVLLALGVALARVLRGRLGEHRPAEAAARLTGLPAVEIRGRAGAPAALAPLHRDHLPHRGAIAVVQLGRPSDHDVGRTLATSAALVATRSGAEPPRPGAAPDEEASVPQVRTVRGRRVDQALLEAARRAEGPAVLAVDTSRTGRRALEEAVAALRAVGAEVLGVVVWRGRFPRERRGRPAPLTGLPRSGAPDAGPGVADPA